MAGERKRVRSTWQLQEAKNRLSEVVKCAISIGPQTITLHGKAAAVVVSCNQFREIRRSKGSLVDFLSASPLRDVELDLRREDDLGRDVTI